MAEANGDKADSTESKVLRDKAYTLLAEKARIIRDYDRYVFWKNEDKLKRYYV